MKEIIYATIVTVSAIAAYIDFSLIRMAISLVICFAIMFLASFFMDRRMGADYSTNTSIAFTVAGNNLELALAVAISVFGVNSRQAGAGVIEPLVEVPAIIALVKVNFWQKRRFYDTGKKELA